jgi:hypothetical protein
MMGIVQYLEERQLVRQNQPFTYNTAVGQWDEPPDSNNYVQLYLALTPAGEDEADKIVKQRKQVWGRRLLTFINHNWTISLVAGTVAAIIAGWLIWKFGWNK